MKTIEKKLLILLILLISATTSFGQSKANGLQDLVGAKGSSAENELQNRGFAHIKTSKSNYDVYSYWWNNRERKCVSYHLTDGRIKSIVKTMPFDCNKSENGSGIHSSHSYNSYNENYSHKKYNSDNFNNSYRTRDSNEYNGHAEVHDLMKISASLAYERLQDRGFVNVKTVKGQDKLYKIWYNNETNQCIKTVSLHKHIHDILKSTHCH